jgi:hypothetical protein
MIKSINHTTLTKFVGPKEFLDVVKKNQSSILKSEIVPPKLGSRGLGGFKITYKVNTYNIK